MKGMQKLEMSSELLLTWYTATTIAEEEKLQAEDGDVKILSFKKKPKSAFFCN